MGRELTPLEALENIKREAGFPYFSTLYDIDMWREDFKTVETALKENEVYQFMFHEVKYYVESKEFSLEDLAKKLKALEIIKNKQVDMNTLRMTFVMNKDFTFYNEDLSFGEELTKEEYELLKEVLND